MPAARARELLVLAPSSSVSLVQQPASPALVGGWYSMDSPSLGRIQSAHFYRVAKKLGSEFSSHVKKIECVEWGRVVCM